MNAPSNAEHHPWFVEIKLLHLRSAPSVSEQPRVALHSWRMVEDAMGRQYIVALTPSGSLRTTSAVIEVALGSRTVTTQSGRVYELREEPVQDPLLCAAFLEVQRHNGFAEMVDVSETLWALMEAAKH